MAEGRIINLYKGAQYVERTDSVINNYYYRDNNEELDCTEIKDLIENLYELIDENGDKVFKDQDQWYAVYRVLSKLKTIPDSMPDFVEFIKNNKLGEKKPVCKYESIKKAGGSLPHFAVDVKKWAQYKDASDQYRKQYQVASFLLKTLENL